MDNETPKVDWKARALAAEAIATEYRDHGERVKRELLSALQRQDERLRELVSKLTVAEYRIAELQPLADLARKIGMARQLVRDNPVFVGIANHIDASRALDDLLDQAAALGTKS
jgi:hypothetical protein